jgi:alpha-beta hydrolase superfamily lysophospholipase
MPGHCIANRKVYAVREVTWTLLRPDGISLYVRDAVPTSTPVRGCIVGVTSVYDAIEWGWLNFLQWFAQRGFRCRLYELRGCARSEGGGADVTDMSVLIDDFLSVCEDLSKPDVPVFALGYGGSACISLMASLQQSYRFHGLVLQSPVFGVNEPSAAQHRLEMLSQVAPELRLPSGIDLSLTARSADMERYLKSDLIRQGVRANLLHVLSTNLPAAAKLGSKISLPTLIMTGTNDKIVFPGSISNFADTVPPKLLTLKSYEGAYHSLHAEPAEVRSRVWADIETWIVAHR